MRIMHDSDFYMHAGRESTLRDLNDERSAEAAAEDADADGSYYFYYKDAKESLFHNLALAEWGTTKSWVILHKAPPTTAREKSARKRN